MDIDVFDCISADRRKEIAEEVFRDACLENFRNNAERIFSNAAYHAVFRMVDEQHDGKVADIIAAKVAEVIPKLTEYSVFRRAGIGERADSFGAKAMDQAVRDNLDAVDAAVKAAIATISKSDLMDLISEGDFSVSIKAT